MFGCQNGCVGLAVVSQTELGEASGTYLNVPLRVAPSHDCLMIP